MNNFIKSLLPNIISAAGNLFLRLSKIFNGIAAIFFAIATTLHMLFETDEGRKLKEIERATETIVNMYTNLVKRAQSKKASAESEDNRLAKILKNNKNVTKIQGKNDGSSDN